MMSTKIIRDMSELAFRLTGNNNRQAVALKTSPVPVLTLKSPEPDVVKLRNVLGLDKDDLDARSRLFANLLRARKLQGAVVGVIVETPDQPFINPDLGNGRFTLVGVGRAVPYLEFAPTAPTFSGYLSKLSESGSTIVYTSRASERLELRSLGDDKWDPVWNNNFSGSGILKDNGGGTDNVQLYPSSYPTAEALAALEETSQLWSFLSRFGAATAYSSDSSPMEKIALVLSAILKSTYEEV